MESPAPRVFLEGGGAAAEQKQQSYHEVKEREGGGAFFHHSPVVCCSLLVSPYKCEIVHETDFIVSLGGGGVGGGST